MLFSIWTQEVSLANGKQECRINPYLSTCKTARYKRFHNEVSFLKVKIRLQAQQATDKTSEMGKNELFC
jgi:hypothetical protein